MPVCFRYIHYARRNGEVVGGFFVTWCGLPNFAKSAAESQGARSLGSKLGHHLEMPSLAVMLVSRHSIGLE